MGKFMKYCETAGLRKESVLQWEASEQGSPPLPHHLLLTRPRKHSECYKAQPFPAPYEKITTVPKVLKKKNPKRLWPLLFDHSARCFHVQVDLNRFVSPSTDSEVVTALG